MSHAHIPQSSQLDLNDPLAFARDNFRTPANTIYLDGNSLGVLPHSTEQHLKHVVTEQWGQSLISGWNQHDWIGLPLRVGDKIGKIIGAAPGQTVCCDTISVNLFKLLNVALSAQPSRAKVISTQDNFPTDLYMVQGVEDLLGKSKCMLETVDERDIFNAIDDTTAVVLVTQVNFRSGAILDIPGIVDKAHKNGAVVILDLAHSAGVLPVELDAWGVDFAIGCTYKYLNGGPGAPGFAYVNQRHFSHLNQPLYGWMGHAKPFEFDPTYQGAKDIRQLLTGTQPILSMSAVDCALDIFSDVSISQVREKSIALTDYFHRRVCDAGLDDILHCISPLDGRIRGSQLSYSFEHAYALCQALIARGVIPDFRAPDVIRFGFAPLYTRFADIDEAVNAMREIIENQAYLGPQYQVRQRVT